ncbi:hypothetical protein MMC25_000500 [Agyrium rufum]|nr:hypothetical protein [Agyrium rufum]
MAGRILRSTPKSCDPQLCQSSRLDAQVAAMVSFKPHRMRCHLSALSTEHMKSQDPVSSIARLEAILDTPIDRVPSRQKGENAADEMDPLSFTASLITVVTVAVQVTQGLQKLRQLHGASGAVHAILNEVTDVRIILSDINAVVAGHKTPDGEIDESLSSVCRTADQIKEALLELDTLINKRLFKSSGDNGDSQVRKLVWVREKSNIQEILHTLRRLRLDLVTGIGARSLASSLNTNFRVQELSFIVNDSLSDQRSFQDRALEALEQLQLQSVAAQPDSIANVSANEPSVAAEHVQKEKYPITSNYKSVEIRMSRNENSCGA